MGVDRELWWYGKDNIKLPVSHKKRSLKLLFYELYKVDNYSALSRRIVLLYSDDFACMRTLQI